MVRISASILGFYFEAKQKKVSSTVMIDKINSEIKRREDQFDILHLDIEDGMFVKNKSFTPSMIKNLKCNKKKESHLMVVDYNKYLKEFFDLSDMFIIHNEVLKKDFDKTIDFLHKNNKKVGISINPETKISEINEEYLKKIDLILVMSVHPGLPGQTFIEECVLKVKKLYELRKKKKYDFVIEIDGGINENNIKKCESSGADIVVMGSHFFK